MYLSVCQKLNNQHYYCLFDCVNGRVVFSTVKTPLSHMSYLYFTVVSFAFTAQRNGRKCDHPDRISVCCTNKWIFTKMDYSSRSLISFKTIFDVKMPCEPIVNFLILLQNVCLKGKSLSRPHSKSVNLLNGMWFKHGCLAPIDSVGFEDLICSRRGKEEKWSLFKLIWFSWGKKS